MSNSAVGFSISFSADEHYATPLNGSLVPQYENAKQFVATPRRLVNFLALNTSAATVFILLLDTKNGGTDYVNGDTQSAHIFEVPAGGIVSISIHWGRR